jgi:hypothetical protein
MGGGYVEVARVLLLAGADRNIADNRGRTPLQVAKQYREEDFVAVIEVRTTTDILVIQPTVRRFRECKPRNITQVVVRRCAMNA